MSSTPTFTAHYPWLRHSAPATQRPYSEVHIRGPLARVRVWCLVDSGADRLLVEDAVATKAGINLAAGTSMTSLSASGASFTIVEVSPVEVSVEKVTKTNQAVRFAPGALPLLGRVTFLSFFADVGFDAKGWQHS